MSPPGPPGRVRRNAPRAVATGSASAASGSRTIRSQDVDSDTGSYATAAEEENDPANDSHSSNDADQPLVAAIDDAVRNNNDPILRDICNLFKASNDSANRRFKRLQDTIKAQQQTLKTQQNAIVIMERRLSDLEKIHEEKINELEARIDDLDQYGRRTNLLFYGIPEQHNEDTDDIVLKVVNEKLNIRLDKKDLGRSHRLGAETQRGGAARIKPRSIIARFLSYRVRQEIYGNKRRLKPAAGSNARQTVYINENLTIPRQAIFKAAWKLRKANKLSGVWTQDGLICVKLPTNGPFFDAPTFRFSKMRQFNDWCISKNIEFDEN